MRKLKLMFVHVPKTGGTSITKAMKMCFGEKLYHDHDGPGNPASPMNMDPDGFLYRHHNSDYKFLHQKEAVTGHIWIRKYDPIATEIRATILRHPIERAISHYFFWRSPAIKYKHPVRTYMLNMKLDFFQFAQMPTMRWFYSRYLFRNTDMTTFDFIGDYRALKADWEGVIHRLGLRSQRLRINQTKSYSSDYPVQYSNIVNNPLEMNTLREVFADDIAFYERWTGRS